MYTGKVLMYYDIHQISHLKIVTLHLLAWAIILVSLYLKSTLKVTHAQPSSERKLPLPITT